MLKENITNISIGDGFRLGNLGRSLMLPPLPVPMTGFLNGYQQRMQANFPTIPEFEVFGKAFNGFEGRSGRSNRKPLVINTSDAIKSPVQRPFVMAIQGDIASIPGFNAESFLEKHLKKSRKEQRDEYLEDLKKARETMQQVAAEVNPSDAPPVMPAQPPSALTKFKEGAKDLASAAATKLITTALKEVA